MKPPTLHTKLFLDSGDPKETRAVLDILGFLDGQTTNPSLISKNPETAGKKFSTAELLFFYRNVVQEIAGLIPQGSVSVEVYADSTTRAEEMVEQGREMFSWIPNAHIKFPTSREGLKAAAVAVKEGMRVNMTLCFTQEQAAAVYAATKGAKKGDVFVSPFVGRLDDRGENGMQLISNILKMYKQGDGHVEVLTASVRGMGHVLGALNMGSDIITAPATILKEWAEQGMPLVEDNKLQDEALAPIAFKEINSEQSWENFDISHELTDNGMKRFSEDWNNLLR